MPFFTRTPPRGIEIPRLINAAHEIGHYIAFCEAGIRVSAVKLEEIGDVDGYNIIDDPAADQNHAYLIAVMAGTAGERFWCDAHGQRLPAECRDGTSWRGDRAEFRAHTRQHRSDRALRGLSERKAIKQAHQILRDNAKRFRKLTEQLARDGALRI